MRGVVLSAVVAVASAAAAAALLVAGSGDRPEYGPPASDSPITVTARDSEPVRSEATPEIRSAAAGDQAAPAAAPPVRVEVPDAGIDVPAEPVGVLPDGGMQIPENPSVSGWYRYGAAPATDRGSVVIAAHVDSLEYGLGPFARLRDVPAGSSIVVSTTDGERHTYLVESLAYYPKQELPTDELFDRVGPERLVVITCGGEFDQATRTYSDNVVVTATPID